MTPKLVPRYEIGPTGDDFVTADDAALLEAIIEAADALRAASGDIGQYCECGEPDCWEFQQRERLIAYDAARAKVGEKP